MTRPLACGFASALVCALVAGLATASVGAEEPRGRVLFIGIDGCRFDALQTAKAPHLHRLRAEGCYSDHTLIQGDRYQGSDTVSGPGWSSLLTGVWADKHGVDSNRFETPHYDRYPHFFRHVKTAFPKAKTASIAAWPPINDHITSDADVVESPSFHNWYMPGDRQAATRAVELLQRDDFTVLFVYFGQVDEFGHQHGFSPQEPEYIQAIERVDAHVGRVLAALYARPKLAEENWLVLVSSDHGGRGKDHGGGRGVPEIMNSFLIVNGQAAARGKIEGPTFLVDVPVTALRHLNVPLVPQWQLDGKPVGLQSR